MRKKFLLFFKKFRFFYSKGQKILPPKSELWYIKCEFCIPNTKDYCPAERAERAEIFFWTRIIQIKRIIFVRFVRFVFVYCPAEKAERAEIFFWTRIVRIERINLFREIRYAELKVRKIGYAELKVRVRYFNM